VADVAVAPAPISVTVFTDPYCPWSWAAEPHLRRLDVEFGAGVAVTFVMVGLRRHISDATALAVGASRWTGELAPATASAASSGHLA